MKVTVKERKKPGQRGLSERVSDQALADSYGRAVYAGDSPEIIVMQKGRSRYEVVDGRALIKINVAEKEHWGEAIAHEMGHWALAHVPQDNPEDMFRQELEAWEWAMKKGLKFDRKFVADCLFSHSAEFSDPVKVVNAMVRADAMLNRYKKNWKPEA